MVKRTSNPRKIDRIRDAAFSLEVRTPDDDSAIVEMISTGDRLLVVKGKGIFEIKLADEVDPERTNVAIPNTIQQVIPYGADAPWIGAVVLTAHGLFQRSCFLSEIDGALAFAMVLEMAEEIAGAHQIEEKYHNAEEEVTEKLNPKIREDRSFVVPALGNVESRCNEFLQRADHTLQKLFKLVQMFYPDVGSGGWDKLKEKIGGESQDTDNFSHFLAEIVPFLLLIRNARNCVEHPRSNQKLVVTNFCLDSQNILLPPMIEIIHPRTPMKEVPLGLFFQQTLQSLVTAVELMMVFLCIRHVKPFGGLAVQVIEIPADRRKHAHVRFGYYCAVQGDKIVPMD